jgi:hypothetical protein
VSSRVNEVSSILQVYESWPARNREAESQIFGGIFKRGGNFCKIFVNFVRKKFYKNCFRSSFLFAEDRLGSAWKSSNTWDASRVASADCTPAANCREYPQHLHPRTRRPWQDVVVRQPARIQRHHLRQTRWKGPLPRLPRRRADTRHHYGGPQPPSKQISGY